ncbi:MAG TPA: Sir2 family NAD-dependent protein deacetylase [Kiritimatiellia bacterium]|mgnify:CR=1 FL=1|nr:Sir2 family NAD-dependent protein deacetylase [Kiritimatiellia bacterium]HRU70431.1 Sir2 family NAD-dependent protein deacetylase [Kiritimatiellia bacterium]
MKTLIEKLKQAQCVAAFTGAGVSTLCGIPDFRGPQGLYKQPDAERIFDIGWFRRDPSIYYTGCMELVYGLRRFKPGPVHHALALLERAGIVRGIITQNIDMLHQKAGSKVVYEVHGSPILHHCFKCGREKNFDEICAVLEKMPVPLCELCGGAFKPDITFFGEALPEQALDASIALAQRADLMLVLGSSLVVHPAASIPPLTVRAGGELVIINAQPTPLDHIATLRYPDLTAFADAVLKMTGLATERQ